MPKTRIYNEDNWFHKLFLSEAKAAVESQPGGDSQIDLQKKTVTEPGTYSPDAGYEGFSKFTVDIPVYEGEVTN